ncbi:DEAD/DEAH box helicase [Segetibacter sp. 3557_3]|uniref:SNF2-related protein n=1 Tax=Segetibacter sp. 3557_3 TaxID=2547429 RepID=UPI001058E887|nr:SNF2-related protein [Segetibacter sp. 3557_3]TDH23963.1 DEAD/DEAH box helicase [Segetibacter sp. 3557_3]
MELTPLHAKYFAHELTRRYSSNSLQKFTASLADAQVDLNPHQVEAALFAFKSPLSKGAILADEVGLGKTIEAGIVISQKWAERRRKILIIAPANLRKQWNQEISDKFFLPSYILEAKSFNETIKSGNLNPFIQKDNIVICSYQFARSKDVYIKQIDWDLVVIDEAHRLRNVYKSSNKIGKAIKEALLPAPKILLTATPLQNSLLELYGLVSIIDEYTFGDLKSFKTQFTRLSTETNFEELKRRLEPICKRTLRRQVLEYIKYTNRIALTQDFYPTEDEQRLYNLVSDYLQSDNLYALPPSQRQLMTLILRKLLASSTYAISGTLEALANKLETIVNKQNSPALPFEETVATNFETYDELKDEWLDDEEEETGKEERIYNEHEIQDIRKEIEALKDFKKLAVSIRINSKGEVLFTALEKGFEKLQELGANRKAIIFTESTRTQEYLKNSLEARGYKNEIVLFNGSNNDPLSISIYKAWIEKHKGTDIITGSRTADKRAALVDYFRETATIMIATEAAAEGINLQFCSLVVNYDLPWNPQRIEQRIGRCHRYGQKHDVVVVNFLNRANAADQRVYQLLDEKFQLFHGVFGASDEVLGTIESGIDFEKRIVNIYQTCRTPEAIQSAFDKLQEEMESGIAEQIDITRKTLLENFDEEVHEKLRFNLLQSRDYLGKFEDWLWSITKFYLEPYAVFDHSDDSFYLKENPFPKEPIHSGPYRIGKNIDDANIYRVGHPLAQKVIQQCKILNLPLQQVVFDLSGSKKLISILEPLKGATGWLQLQQLTITSFEAEDYLMFAAFTDDGIVLDKEQCHRLFSLAAENAAMHEEFPEELQTKFDELYHAQVVEISQENAERNNHFFDEEVEKLDKWAEDVRNSLKFELKELEKEIKSRKTEARKLLNLEQKVKEQRAIKELEKRLSEKRMSLYQSEDDIDTRKEGLLDEIEKRLKQQSEKQTLFTIKWQII